MPRVNIGRVARGVALPVDIVSAAKKAHLRAGRDAGYCVSTTINHLVIIKSLLAGGQLRGRAGPGRGSVLPVIIGLPPVNNGSLSPPTDTGCKDIELVDLLVDRKQGFMNLPHSTRAQAAAWSARTGDFDLTGHQQG